MERLDSTFLGVSRGGCGQSNSHRESWAAHLSCCRWWPGALQLSSSRPPSLSSQSHPTSGFSEASVSSCTPKYPRHKPYTHTHTHATFWVEKTQRHRDTFLWKSSPQKMPTSSFVQNSSESLSIRRGAAGMHTQNSKSLVMTFRRITKTSPNKIVLQEGILVAHNDWKPLSLKWRWLHAPMAGKEQTLGRWGRRRRYFTQWQWGLQPCVVTRNNVYYLHTPNKHLFLKCYCRTLAVCIYCICSLHNERHK